MNKKIMRSAICAVLLSISGILSAQTARNIAYEDATVRFTVITDGVIRLEWQPEGEFTDNTLAKSESQTKHSPLATQQN